MTETYLNGKITVTSLAAPTDEDLKKIRALSEDERTALLAEKLQRGKDSPVGTRTPEEIWDKAKARASVTKTKPEHAL